MTNNVVNFQIDRQRQITRYSQIIVRQQDKQMVKELDRQIDRQIDRKIDRYSLNLLTNEEITIFAKHIFNKILEKYNFLYIYRWFNRQIDKQIDRQMYRQIANNINRWIYIQIDRQKIEINHNKQNNECATNLNFKRN